MMYRMPLFNLLMLIFLKANDPAELKPCSKGFIVSSGRYLYALRDENNAAEPCSREFVWSFDRIHSIPIDEYEFIRSRIIWKKYFATKKISEVAKPMESQNRPLFYGLPTHTLHRTKLATMERLPTWLGTKGLYPAHSFMTSDYGKSKNLIFASEISNYDIPAARSKQQRFYSKRSRDYMASAIETFLSYDADYGLDSYVESEDDKKGDSHGSEEFLARMKDYLNDRSEKSLPRKKGNLIYSPLDSSEEGLLTNKRLISDIEGDQILDEEDTSSSSYEYSDMPEEQSILQNVIDYDTGINSNEDKNSGEDQIISDQNIWSWHANDPISFINSKSDHKASATQEDLFRIDKSEDEQTTSNEKEYEIWQEDLVTSRYGLSESSVIAQEETMHGEQDSDASQYGVPESNIASQQHKILHEEHDSDISPYEAPENKNRPQIYKALHSKEQQHEELQDKQDLDAYYYDIFERQVKEQDSHEISYETIKNEDEQKIPNHNGKRTYLDNQDSFMERHFKVQESNDGSYEAVKNEKEKMVSDEVESQRSQPELDSDYMANEASDFDVEAHGLQNALFTTNESLEEEQNTTNQNENPILQVQQDSDPADSQYSEPALCFSCILGKDFQLQDYLKNLYSNAKTADGDKISDQKENQNKKTHGELLPYGILGNIYKFYDYFKSLYSKSISTDEQKPSPELNGIVSKKHIEHALQTVAEAVTESATTSDFGVNEERNADIGYTQLFVNKLLKDSIKRSVSEEARFNEPKEEYENEKEAAGDDYDEDTEDKNIKETEEDEDKSEKYDEDVSEKRNGDDKKTEENELAHFDGDVPGKRDNDESEEDNDDKKKEKESEKYDDDASEEGDGYESEEHGDIETEEDDLETYDDDVSEKMDRSGEHDDDKEANKDELEKYDDDDSEEKDNDGSGEADDDKEEEDELEKYDDIVSEERHDDESKEDGDGKDAEGDEDELESFDHVVSEEEDGDKSEEDNDNKKKEGESAKYDDYVSEEDDDMEAEEDELESYGDDVSEKGDDAGSKEHDDDKEADEDELKTYDDDVTEKGPRSEEHDGWKDDGSGEHEDDKETEKDVSLRGDDGESGKYHDDKQAEDDEEVLRRGYDSKSGEYDGDKEADEGDKNVSTKGVDIVSGKGDDGESEEGYADFSGEVALPSSLHTVITDLMKRFQSLNPF